MVQHPTPPRAEDINIIMCEVDLPDGLTFADGYVAVDTESLGLKPHRDRLCLCQVSDGSGTVWLVPFHGADFSKAKNLKKHLNDDKLCKIMHFARADIAMLELHLGVKMNNVFCTKIASKLCRTYTDRHSLNPLCEEFLGLKLNKAQTSSNWAAEHLTEEQKIYAADDVLYLHVLRHILEERLKEQGRFAHAEACFKYLPARARLDLAGWDEVDIFAHH